MRHERKWARISDATCFAEIARSCNLLVTKNHHHNNWGKEYADFEFAKAILSYSLLFIRAAGPGVGSRGEFSCVCSISSNVAEPIAKSSLQDCNGWMGDGPRERSLKKFIFFTTPVVTQVRSPAPG